MNDWSTLDPAWAWAPWQPTAEQPWNRRLAAHWYRRAAFCATPKEIDDAVQGGLPRLLDESWSGREEDRAFDREMDEMGERVAASQDARRLASWWLLRLAQTPRPVVEKLTLFWHGHFATSAAKVRDGRAMLAQNQTLRRAALGPFEDLVQAMSRDVAMLVYLDSTDNRKTRPNENYARELLELFCLGLGQYSERDIKELARCFTGWEVRQGHFNFNPAQHDRGEKTLFGESGAWDGEEAVRIVVRQPAAPRFIARKLIRFYVAEDVDVPERLVEPLADQLRTGSFEIGPVVRTILGSNLFFSPHAVGRKVRSPVELVVGLLRSLGVSGNMDQLGQSLETMGQLPFYPPNVKGWDGGRQWINAAALLARQRVARQLIDGLPALSPGELHRRGWSEIARLSPTEMAARLSELWLAVAPPISAMRTLQAAPASLHRLATRLTALPEFQLL